MVGTIFSVRPDGSNFRVIYHFSSLTGKSPIGGLTLADNGKLYGVTQAGGFYGAGTIFSINLDGSEFEILLHLSDQGSVKSGISAKGELIQGTDGFLYGAARLGGDYTFGTLLKIRTDGTGFTIVLMFNGTTTGKVPSSDLLFGSDGRIYGMTAGGGTNQQGTIYSVNPDGTNYLQLFSFEDTDSEASPLGSNPFGKLTEGSDGFLYGFTSHGGSNSKGTIFKINKNGSGFQILTNLDNRASHPAYGPLVESMPGVFLGMTSMGGSLDGGTIFKVTTSGVLTILNDFPQQQTSPRNLISDPSGDFYYGITQAKAEEGGSIFRVSSAGTSYQQLYEVPAGDIITTIFYASTNHVWVSGIHESESFMFRMGPDGSGREDIVTFNTALAGRICPVLSMVETPDGEIFGATDGRSGSTTYIL